MSITLSPLWRVFADAGKALQEGIADWLHRAALAPHQPHDIAGDGTGPAWCNHCNEAWPCAEWRRLDEVAAHPVGEQGMKTP